MTDVQGAGRSGRRGIDGVDLLAGGVGVECVGLVGGPVLGELLSRPSRPGFAGTVISTVFSAGVSVPWLISAMWPILSRIKICCRLG